MVDTAKAPSPGPAPAPGSQPTFRAYSDPVIFRDDRVLRTLLKKEARYIPASPDYFTHVQPDLKRHMRKELADWMLEICEVQGCHPEVFCLAMNYFDRFLSLCPIARSQLQLHGAVCLLVAWKVREHEPLPAMRLVEYSDFNLTLLDIMEWEVLLLSKLDWDMSAVIASDFIEHIIQRVRRILENSVSSEVIRHNSETLLTMCAANYAFSSLAPSLLASAAVLTTLRPALESNEEQPLMETILEAMERITLIHKDDICQVMDRIEVLMQASLPPSPSVEASSSTPSFFHRAVESDKSRSSECPPATPPRLRRHHSYTVTSGNEADRNPASTGSNDEVTPTKVLDVARDC